jgi:hypothetical protein
MVRMVRSSTRDRSNEVREGPFTKEGLASIKDANPL